MAEDSTPPVAPSPAPLLGGRYVLLEKLGVGGMSTVYRAYDQRLEVFRAIKILAPRLANKKGVRQRLENEAKVMARLTHPNVVTLFEMGQDESRLYLVMELVAGGSVMERVAQDGPLPPRMAAEVALQVLQALEATHALGIVHRDIKPHNVLLDVAGTVKVTDFGIARHDDLSGLTRTGAVMGTLAYMPPEQKMSARRVDARSDLYAVGGTLYCLLTGKEPFDLYAAGMDEELARDFYAGLPPTLAKVIGRATAFKMEDRFASATEMIAALRRAVGELPDDPTGVRLVSEARIARSKELSSIGPTLLALHATGEDAGEANVSATMSVDSPTGSEDRNAVPASAVGKIPPAPPARLPPTAASAPEPVVAALAPAPDPPSRRGLAVPVVAALVGLLLLVVVGTVGGLSVVVLGLRDDGPIGEQAPPDPPPVPVVPAPLPAPPEVVESPPPAPDAAPVAAPAPVAPSPAPVVAPPPTPAPVVAVQPVPALVEPMPAPVEPAPVQPVPAPAPVEPAVVAPVPAPAPAPAPRSASGWKVSVTSSGKAKPDVMATLAADNTVADRLNRSGRPELMIKCTAGNPAFVVRAGVQAVEPLFSETTEAARSEVLYNGTERVVVNNDPAVKNELRFEKARSWVNKILAARTFTFSYAPSSSPPVTARFTNDNLQELQSALTDFCGF